MTLLGCRIFTDYCSSGKVTKRLVLPENNIICKLLGHVFVRKILGRWSRYEGGDHCFRCNFDKWTDPWT